MKLSITTHEDQLLIEQHGTIACFEDSELAGKIGIRRVRWDTFTDQMQAENTRARFRIGTSEQELDLETRALLLAKEEVILHCLIDKRAADVVAAARSTEDQVATLFLALAGTQSKNLSTGERRALAEVLEFADWREDIQARARELKRRVSELPSSVDIEHGLIDGKGAWPELTDY